MLIDDVVAFCNQRYQNHTSARTTCPNCSSHAPCKHNCVDCLDDIHYHRNNVRTDYSCEHLLDAYECRYAYKYCSEIIHALNTVEWDNYPQLNVLSLGCGGAPDLMAFNRLKLDNRVRYCGIDINHSWEAIHNFIEQQYGNDTVVFNRGVDVREYFMTNTIPNVNILCIEYLISIFFEEIGEAGVRRWFENIAENIVAHKLPDTPMLIIINDVDSYKTGRDTFRILKEVLENRGFNILSERRLYFSDRSYYPDAKKHLSSRNCFVIPNDFVNTYHVAIRCSAAQLLLEVE